MRNYQPLRKILKGYTGNLKIAFEEDYLQSLSGKTLNNFLTYIGFKSTELKFSYFRWPENLDVRVVSRIFSRKFSCQNFFVPGFLSEKKAGHCVVIGGGHGTGWLQTFQKYCDYTLVQGPDDDGFGALIFPLGVTVPAGDIINSFLSIAQVSKDDRTLLGILNKMNLGPVLNCDENCVRECLDYQNWLRGLWQEKCGNLVRKIEESAGLCFENRNLAEFIDFFNDFFLQTPISSLISPDFHDLREGLMYGLFLYFSPYRQRLYHIKKYKNYPSTFANFHELRIIAQCISSRTAIKRAILEIKRIFNIREECEHQLVSFQDRALGGFYSDNRGPFTGVQNAPRGSDTGQVFPEDIYICRAQRHSFYPAFEPEVAKVIASDKTNMIIRSCGSLATTSGQIYRTPGLRQSIEKNPGALKVFIFNNAPELAEGESMNVLQTIQRSARFFQMNPEHFCQVAILPDPDKVNNYPKELRIEQRPGESVAVKLIRGDAKKLIENGILPVFLDAFHSFRRPDLHDNEILAGHLARNNYFHKWERERGLNFTYKQNARMFAQKTNKKPHKILSKELTWQMASAFAAKIFSKQRFKGRYSFIKQQQLINFFQAVACIERFIPPLSWHRKIRKIILFPATIENKEHGTLKLKEIIEMVPVDAFIQGEISFIKTLLQEFEKTKDMKLKQESNARLFKLSEQIHFYREHIVPFYSMLRKKFPGIELLPLSLHRPYAHSLMVFHKGSLFISESIFENEHPPVLSPMLLCSYHYLWCELSRTGHTTLNPFFKELQRDSNFFNNCSPRTLDVLIFSFLLPRGRDLFYIPEKEKRLLLQNIPTLNSLYKARIMPSTSLKSKKKDFSTAKVLQKFLQIQAEPLVKKDSKLEFPLITLEKLKGRVDVLHYFREKLFPLISKRGKRINPNLDPFLHRNLKINSFSQREVLKINDVPILKSWYGRIISGFPKNLRSKADTWLASNMSNRFFTDLNQEFFHKVFTWGKGRDPFKKEKFEPLRRALRNSDFLNLLTCGQKLSPGNEVFNFLLKGNEEDLFVDKEITRKFAEKRRARLQNDQIMAINAIEKAGTIALYHDNSGLEILSHLLFIDILIRSNKRVISFVKDIPFYVSDVTCEDIPQILKLLAASGNAEVKDLCIRLKSAIDLGQWYIPSPKVLGFYTKGIDYHKTPIEIIDYINKSGVELSIFFGESHRGLFYGNCSGSFLLEKEGIYHRRFGDPTYSIWYIEHPVLLLSTVKSPVLLRKIPQARLNFKVRNFQALLDDLSGSTIVDYFPYQPLPGNRF
ncbi:ARMT1-like domain-containing protein [Candidatus Riflebacteria bacterium]